MRFYELTLLISPEISEEESSKLFQKAADFIDQEQGALINKTGLTRQKLGYSLNKKNEAFSGTLNFQTKPQNLEKLEKMLKSEKAILRFMILSRPSPEKIKKMAARMRPRRRTPVRAIETEKETAPRPSDLQKADISEIDKKIEEILKE